MENLKLLNQSIELIIGQKLCPNHTKEQIKDAIFLVIEQKLSESLEQLVDLVVELLSNEQPSNVRTQEALWESELDGAVGFGLSNIFSCSSSQLLMRTFPDADEDFVREYCEREENFDLDKAVDTFRTEGYPRKVTDVDPIYNRLQKALPFVNTAYLKKKAEKLVGQDEIRIQAFVNNTLENNGLTFRQEFLSQEDTTSFQFEQFLEMFPDPEQFFGNPNKKNSLQSPEISQEDLDYALTFLYNKYRKIRKRHIRQVFERMQKRLYDCCLYLDKFPVEMTRERQLENSSESRNTDLLLEVTYLTHRRFLKYHLMYRNQKTI